MIANNLNPVSSVQFRLSHSQFNKASLMAGLKIDLAPKDLSQYQACEDTHGTRCPCYHHQLARDERWLDQITKPEVSKVATFVRRITELTLGMAHVNPRTERRLPDSLSLLLSILWTGRLPMLKTLTLDILQEGKGKLSQTEKNDARDILGELEMFCDEEDVLLILDLEEDAFESETEVEEDMFESETEVEDTLEDVEAFEEE